MTIEQRISVLESQRRAHTPVVLNMTDEEIFKKYEATRPGQANAPKGDPELNALMDSMSVEEVFQFYMDTKDTPSAWRYIAGLHYSANLNKR